MITPPLSLILFRHAKSDWHADGDDDALRPLSTRGRRAARTMGRFLARAGQVPDLALTSPVVRAERTLRLATRAGRWDCPVDVRPALYGEAAEVLAEVRSVPDAVRSLLLIGHEPTWSATAQLLTGATEIRLPTASMLRVALPAERWADIEVGTARIDWLVVPRLLEGRPPPPS